MTEAYTVFGVEYYTSLKNAKKRKLRIDTSRNLQDTIKDMDPRILLDDNSQLNGGHYFLNRHYALIEHDSEAVSDEEESLPLDTIVQLRRKLNRVHATADQVRTYLTKQFAGLAEDYSCVLIPLTQSELSGLFKK